MSQSCFELAMEEHSENFIDSELEELRKINIRLEEEFFFVNFWLILLMSDKKDY